MSDTAKAPVMAEQTQPKQVYSFPEELTKKKNIKKADGAPVNTAPEDEKGFDYLKAKLPSILWGDKEVEELKVEKKEGEEEGKEKEVVPVKSSDETKKEAENNPEEKETEKPAPKKSRKPTVIDTDELIQRSAESTGKAIAEAIKASNLTSPKGIGEEDNVASLSDEDRENYEAFLELAESNPNYKTHPKKFLTFVKQLEARKAKWAKEHPDEEFNPEAEEHEDFYAKHMPQYRDTDLEKARIRIEAKKIANEQSRKYAEDLEKIRSEALAPQIKQEAYSMADEATGVFVGKLEDDSVKSIIKEKGPEGLKDADPIVYDVLNSLASELQNQVIEIHNIARRNNYFDPSNPAHKEISQFAIEQEKRIKSLPIEEQMWDGKRFATRAEIHSMSPDKQNNYWSLGESDLVDLLTAKTSYIANKTVAKKREELGKWAEKYGYTKSPTPSAESKKAAEVPSGNRKPNAPSASAGGALPPTNEPPKKEEQDVHKKLVSSLFS